MDNTTHISFNAEDRSYFSILKKEIHKIASNAGFTTKKIAEIDIIVAEMTSNLIKHGGGGEILVRIFDDDSHDAIELISIDNGPGMADSMRMAEDGMSTSNTLGQGLGAMKRLSNTFELYSLRDWGTIVLSRVYKEDPRFYSKKPISEVRSLVVPKPGELVSGDSTYYDFMQDSLRVFLGDGLGHGPEAFAAVQTAISAMKQSNANTPSDILRHLHAASKKTRGLVATVAIFHFKEKQWAICGIGNIATRSHFITPKNYMSYNGVVGMNIPNTLSEQVVKHERGQTIIMCSDGIKTRWELNKFAGIFRYDLSILAAAIYKDFGRKTDDTSVLVARINT